MTIINKDRNTLEKMQSFLSKAGPPHCNHFSKQSNWPSPGRWPVSRFAMINWVRNSSTSSVSFWCLRASSSPCLTARSSSSTTSDSTCAINRYYFQSQLNIKFHLQMAILYRVEIHNIYCCMPQKRKEVFLTFLL